MIRPDRRGQADSARGSEIRSGTFRGADPPAGSIALLASIGVEEPDGLIDACNDSVDASEFEHLALAEALFLPNHAKARP